MTYINGGHWQWISRYLTPPPPWLLHCIFSVFVLQIPPLHARCGWRFLNRRCEKMHSVPQVCIPLFLPLVINTTPQAMAGARPCNTTRFSTYFAMQAEEVWEGLVGGNRQSSFYKTTPELSWEEYMSPVGHWKQHSQGTASQGPFSVRSIHHACLAA